MIRPLLLLELRRQRPFFVRMLQLAVLVSAVFFLLGKRSAEDQLAAVLGCSFGIVLIVPMGIARDKMEGTLDFICGLPVDASDIAASRFIAVGLFAVPWALVIGAVWLARPFSIALHPLAVTVAAWLTMLTIGAVATALFTCFELESLFGAPILVMLLLVVVLPRVVHVVFPTLTTAGALQALASPAAPLLTAGGALLFLGLSVAIAFVATVRGLVHRR